MSPIRLRHTDDVPLMIARYLLVTNQEIDMHTLTIEQSEHIHGAVGPSAMTAFTPPSPGSPPPVSRVPVVPGPFQPI